MSFTRKPIAYIRIHLVSLMVFTIIFVVVLASLWWWHDRQRAFTFDQGLWLGSFLSRCQTAQSIDAEEFIKTREVFAAGLARLYQYRNHIPLESSCADLLEIFSGKQEE